MNHQIADIIIIGGGITGCCLAYELRKRSFSVVLLEKDTIGGASSGRNGGGVRQQNRVPQELHLAMLSVKVWKEMAEGFDEDVEYRQKGNLRLILSENEIEPYKKDIYRQRASGLDVNLLNEDETRNLLPVLSSEVGIFGGTYCPSDGTANPLLVTKAVARKASELGADIHEHEPVICIEQRHSSNTGSVKVVKSKTGSYESPIIINAAGVWSGNVCEMLGLRLPCEIKRCHIIVSKALSPIIKPFVSFPGGYVRQALNGNLHLGVSPLPSSGYDTSTDVKIFGNIIGFYLKLFPFMEHLPIIRTWAGLIYVTPDTFPIIGEAPGMEGFYLTAGFSGHGFCLGPGAARVLAQTLNGEETDVDLQCFSWDRF